MVLRFFCASFQLLIFHNNAHRVLSFPFLLRQYNRNKNPTKLIYNNL